MSEEILQDQESEVVVCHVNTHTISRSIYA
jgi:hypothetical protein